MAEKCVTLIIPHLKSQHYILLIQVTIFKTKIMDVISSSLSHWNNLGHRKNGDRYWYIYTETGICTIAYLHTHKWAFIFSHCCKHTFNKHPIIFPVGPQMSELSLVFYDSKEGGKISIWFKWHNRVIFLVYLFPKIGKK